MLVLKRKEFSSKAQKALRAKYDLARFNKSNPELANTWGNKIAEKKRWMRFQDKQPERGKTNFDLLNASINGRAEMTPGSFASKRSVEHGVNHPKNRCPSPLFYDRPLYDHASTDAIKTAASIRANKDSMKYYKKLRTN